jgi:hypothetical protein
MKPTFYSRLPRLSIYQLERLSPAALQRRQALEERERADWEMEKRKRAPPRAPTSK